MVYDGGKALRAVGNREQVVKWWANIGKRWRAAILCCALVGATLAGFLLGSRHFDATMVDQRRELAALSQLAAEHAQQQQQLVNLEMADTVNKMAQEKLRQQVAELQTERVKLETELFVYKKLLEDDEAQVGLSLENLVIRQLDGAPGRFSYDIVLRRKSVVDQSVEATLTMEIEGQLHGIPYALTLREADPEVNEDALRISFRYFRVVKGTLVLPAHFVPRNLVVSLYESGHADSLVIKEVAWQPVL